MVQTILDSGITVVITAIFLIIYLRNESLRSKRADEAEQRRLKALEKLELDRSEREEERENFINSILMQQLNKMNQLLDNTKKVHSAEEDEFLEKINSCINDVLIKLRESTSANRAMLVRYHNGTYDLNGISTIKMSATNESVSSGVEPMMNGFKDQHRSFFSWWCGMIREKKTVAIEKIQEVKNIDPNFYYFLKNREVNSVFGEAVLNSKNEVVGFIVIEYLSDFDGNLEKILNCLKDKSKKISALLALTEQRLYNHGRIQNCGR